MDFNELYIHHYPALYKYLLRLTRCEETGKDLTQEVFEKLYMQIEKEKEKLKDPKSWLYKVAYNRFANYYSKKQLENRYQQEKNVTHPGYSESLPDEEQQKHEQFEKGLTKLKTEEYHLIMLYKEGLKYREMAEVLDMNPASVGKTLARTIEKLRILIKEECHELFE
ncbi:MAG: RNA polymerase sigma factor [Salinivirgaceae bacterium]